LFSRLAGVFLLLAVMVLALASPATAQEQAITIRNFDTSERVIALTFDAGSDRGYAPMILDVLKQEGIRATFGMTGSWAEQNPDLILRIVNEGHMMMNHTWSHRSFTGQSAANPLLTAAERHDELIRTENVVREIAGVELRPYFRPPYGDYDDSVLRDIAAIGYTVNVMWTVDSLGWNGLTASQINQRVLAGATPGGNILLHVGESSQDGPALPEMIRLLREAGYGFATVDELARGVVGPQSRFFPETGFEVRDNFLRYWNRFGGLPTFGYPITAELEEEGAVVQYFERARFEYRPGSWPERYDILLGLLGVEYATEANLLNTAPFQRAPESEQEGCAYYQETGHNLCHGFRNHWNNHGALPILGFPISEELDEDGVTVQYFERARFEWHPENDPPWDVLLMHFGRWKLEQRHGENLLP
jgi:peptidoglycan/xylan/chitin deacetylase (PgdA/CDA1 family)